ncbi:hypothetical protein [Bradyrhizobium sp. Ghvi]|uniref:hypothetical protein n=1 Tax=Bradyrhizobium sp. Ghvi TaxID=1855319 RepID=UPI0015A5F930|nr:hypothetical protein [Bradyrhizobium sp. Ghvi]
MSTLLSVSQARLAVPRICNDGGFLDGTAATRKQGSWCKRRSFTNRFIDIAVSETGDNRPA